MLLAEDWRGSVICGRWQVYIYGVGGAKNNLPERTMLSGRQKTYH